MGQAFLPPSSIPPATCPHCGHNAHCIHRTLDPKKTSRELRTFECESCGWATVDVSDKDASSDADIQAFAERMTQHPKL